MQYKVDKREKMSLETKASLIASLITILWFLSNFFPSYQKQLKLLAESFGISSTLLQLLVLLILLVILTLFFALRCILKIHKINNSSNKIDDIDTFHSKNPFLPPKEDMGPLLLEISKSNRFIPDFLSPNFFIKRELLKSYISILTEYKFIKHTGTTEQDRLGAPAKYYSVEPKGYEYLTAYGFLKK